MKRLLLLALSLLVLSSCALLGPRGPKVAARSDWGRFFDEAGVRGTLVLMKSGEGKAQVHDPARARERFLPASTFKILNASIALETGAVSGPDELFKWDGVHRSVAAWNKDMTLKEAFALSCVPVFQEIARRIGEDAMEAWVRGVGYGNGEIAGGIDSFWLQGALRISAMEQVEFLDDYRRGVLPFSARTTDMVKDMMVSASGEDWTVRAKTGWAARTQPGVGWWVGWVERGGEAWYFALNIDMDSMEQAKARQRIVMAVLKAEGILP